MPLLSAETFVFPPDFLHDPTPRGDTLERWWVLHTRPRAEKSLARQLLRHSLAFFLPVYRRQWRWKSRLQSSFVPLFPGYLFLYGDNQARIIGHETNLVARAIPVEDQRQLQRDLASIYRLITSNAPLLPEDKLEPGMRVEITSGAFAGLEGTILQRRNRLRLLVEVQFLQCGVSVEIENWMIRSLDREKIAHVGAQTD
jgi:transcription antitermination factor NusG